MKKEYSNGDVTIVWQPGKCIHSENCVKGLANVFKPNDKPWIQPENASGQEIIDTVSRCPSGALTIKGENQSTAEGHGYGDSSNARWPRSCSRNLHGHATRWKHREKGGSNRPLSMWSFIK